MEDARSRSVRQMMATAWPVRWDVGAATRRELSCPQEMVTLRMRRLGHGGRYRKREQEASVGPASIIDMVRGGAEAISVALWHMVLLLAGGAEGGVWRWAFVELGMLVVLLIAGGAVASTGLKVGSAIMPRIPMVRWIPAAIVALPFGTIWASYAIMQSQAMNVMMHPSELR